jgi:hypothetical protein
MKSIELLNSEGPVLVLEKKNEFFILKNTSNKVLGCLTKKEIINFLNGDLSILDGSGSIINYMSYPESMKPESTTVNNFIGK